FGPPHYWNLWQGWPIPPAPGDWSLMRQHIMGVVCTGNQQHYDYVICWMATMVQRPNVQGKVALILKGLKGSGKGILFHYLRRMLGQHGLYISNAAHLVGNFKAHLRDCI